MHSNSNITAQTNASSNGTLHQGEKKAEPIKVVEKPAPKVEKKVEKTEVKKPIQIAHVIDINPMAPIDKETE